MTPFDAVVTLHRACSGLVVAIELIKMQVQHQPGVDMTDQQIADVINTAMDNGREALVATAQYANADG